jgi:hypothetical protein
MIFINKETLELIVMDFISWEKSSEGLISYTEKIDFTQIELNYEFIGFLY